MYIVFVKKTCVFLTKKVIFCNVDFDYVVDPNFVVIKMKCNESTANHICGFSKVKCIPKRATREKESQKKYKST
jgi:hypothetical protein